MGRSSAGDRPRISNAENTQKPGSIDENTASKPLKSLIPLKNRVSLLSIYNLTAADNSPTPGDIENFR
ncbi:MULTISPECIES: hypothetical protein [Microcoleaceae]|uniref:hypothetical protein n=1 Tax=Microcoleaceae TaxID=1892252 RepID=UPI0018818D6C|nr:hypothetical protein [Tychonema sp. LEGE 06208]MBE9161221.1 hypothetical protein [Tychonema sp. LEGE 06208]